MSWSTPTKANIGLGSVENTALSTWAGTTSITILGTIATGVWHGTAIGDSYISSAATWNAKQAAYTNLTGIGSLANASGWLLNNGSGTFSYSTPTKSDVGLGSVENTALSTWAGTTSITTLGTIASGTWHGSIITYTYIDTGIVLPTKVPLANDRRFIGGSRHEEIWADVAATTRTVTGVGSGFTPSGTITSADGTDGIWHNYATATTLNAQANYSHVRNARRTWGAEGLWIIKTGSASTDIQSVILKVGFQDATFGLVSVDNGNTAAFVFSTSRSDANWQCTTNDASGTTGQVQDSGIAVATSTIYAFYIRMLAASVEFYIGTGADAQTAVQNLALVKTNTTKLPVTATSLAIQFSVTNLSAGTARNCKWSRHMQIQA